MTKRISVGFIFIIIGIILFCPILSYYSVDIAEHIFCVGIGIGGLAVFLYGICYILIDNKNKDIK